jgi:hypothetical protein
VAREAILPHRFSASASWVSQPKGERRRLIVAFSFFFLRKRLHVILQAGDPVQRLARGASGVEFGRGEPRERWAAPWRFAAVLARFGRGPRLGGADRKT